MEVVKYKCSLCQDTKHYQDRGVWKRCDCLKKELAERKYTQAGITFKLEDLDLKTINLKFPQTPIDPISLNSLVNIESVFKKHDFPGRLFCIKGSNIGPKDMAVQCILKGAVESGFTVVQKSMQDLIKDYFKDDVYNGLEEDFKTANVFVLDFGVETQFNVGGVFLQELVRYSNKYHIYLLLTTFLKFDTISLKYGEEVGKLFMRPGTETSRYDRRIVFLPLEA